MPTFRNERNGRSVTTDFTNEEAARIFTEAHGDDNSHWMWFWIHQYALTHRTRHATATNKESGSLMGPLSFLADSFIVAIAYGLKRPMIRVHYRDQRFKFYLSRKGTVCIKSGMLDGEGSHDPVGNEFYVGCLIRGNFLPASNEETREVRRLSEVEAEFLDHLGKDPVPFLAQCSKDMNRCCYCNKPLEDKRSKDVGYGQVCAKHWGLPWGTQAYREKVKSFSSEYGQDAAAICVAIRKDPSERLNWDALNDWLQEQGMPPTSPYPARNVVIPRV